VGVLESFGHLAGDAKSLFQGHRAPDQTPGQILPGNELQYQKELALKVFEPVDGGDMRMVEGGEKTSFPFEAEAVLLVAKQWQGDGFDGNIPSEPGIVGAIHLPHTPRAYSFSNFVMSKDLADHPASCSYRLGGFEATSEPAGRSREYLG
jgi:hypothetical protein